MIKNQKQYASALRSIDDFTTKLRAASSDLEKNAILALKSDIEREINNYILLKNGKKKTFNIKNLREISNILISFRISKNLTQNDLADILETSQQQVNRWENTDYEKASFWHLLDVCEALEIEFDITAKSSEEDNTLDENNLPIGMVIKDSLITKQFLYSSKDYLMVSEEKEEILERNPFPKIETSIYSPLELSH
ncbi:helix-turn-helix transcriptional regulator [Gluconobacter kondonii]|uniref:helix-turn-helix transcriptional regulator n=1 Tax=Gluconobacter kondonii TaxID=941463 RepID=UPI001B8C83EF|nr:helix-turn-helix transcriptional regulator [Gluconobacter kondonii]MBS1055021.1 helix-turn-helix transcriptional regulator [Gluconobacter kondonii]